MSKPKIVIVHGWAYSLEKWPPLIQLLEQAGYECHLLRVPGLTAEIDRAWKIDDYVAWLDQELQQLGHTEPVILLGHSNGGRIILTYTHRFPQKVKQLILIDSAGVPSTDLKTRLKKAIFRVLAKVGKLLTQSALLKKWLYTLAREQDYHQASPIMKQTMANLLEVNVLPWLPDMTQSVLLIWGRRDGYTPLADGQKMLAALPQAQLHILPDARHSPHFTHPAETARLIINYLSAS